jgi:CheY-like chemotaxis protein
MYRPEPQTRRGSSRVEPGSSQEPGSSRDPWLSQRQAFHDAANWLTVLLGHLEMLREHPGSARHLELARRAARAAHRLCALPPGSGRAAGAVDALRHGARVIEHLRPAAERQGITLEFAGSEVPKVAADAPGFDDAILNLLRNALEVTPRGGRVRLIVEKAGPGFVAVQVQDGGPGVSKEVRTRLGDPGRSTKSGVDRGLGLSRVVEWLAGYGTDLEVEDAPGGGASIGFSLGAVPAVPARPPVRGGALRILLVEDDVAVAEVLALLLATDGHQVEHAGDLAAAEAAFIPGAFDLALCDQNLPDGRGEDLATSFLTADPSIACFLVTGSPESVNCSDDPRLRVLAKPVSRDQLRRAVADVAPTRPDPAPSGDV